MILIRREHSRILLLLIALVIILRSPTLFESMYLVDEGYAGAVATELLYGGTLYQTAVETRAPLFYYLYYGIFRIAGQNNLLAVHVVAILFVIATAWTIRAIGTVIADARSGSWAAIGYVIFSHAYLPRDTLAANVEIFTVLPLSLGMLCFFIGERKRQPIWLLICGALIGASTFFRQPCALNIGVIGIYLVYKWFITRTIRLWEAVAAGLWITAGTMLVTGGVLLYFQSQGNLREMIDWAWLIATRYVDSETTVAFVIKRVFLVHVTFIVASGLLWYFGVGQLITILREDLKDPRRASEAGLIGLWFVAAYFSLFIGWRFPGHYHLTALPPLAVLGGIGFTRFLQRLAQENPPKIRRVRRGLVSAAIIPALGFLLMAFIVRKETLAFTPITDYITAHTQPKDRIFVWGSAPYIYSFSGRRMAARFVSCSHLIGMYASRPHKDIDESKWIVPGSWDMLDSDLNAHPPELFIDMSPILDNWGPHQTARYPALRAYLEAYSLEKTIMGAHIYRRTAS